MKKVIYPNIYFIGIISLIVSLFLLEGCSKMSTPHFQHMTLPKTQNYYLVCPEKYCNVTPNRLSPSYPVSAEDLFNDFNQVISEEPRVNFTYSIPEEGQFQLVQKSLILRFPNDIAVQFIALSDNSSTLAIYSQSRYGVYDFGENKRRIDRWLDKLQKKVEVGH
jgi:uncharacterized protein (DUF1499 family)